MSNLGKKHWEAIKSILRYLSGIADQHLCYGHGELTVHGYVDTDYAGCVDNRRSTMGWVYPFAGALLFLGDLFFRIVCPFLLQKQNRLPLLKLARKQYGLLA